MFLSLETNKGQDRPQNQGHLTYMIIKREEENNNIIIIMNGKTHALTLYMTSTLIIVGVASLG